MRSSLVWALATLMACFFRRSDGDSGCSTRSPICLYWGVLGTTCLGRNLAAICGARHMGHSEGFYPGGGNRGIFHLSNYANAAAFIGTPCASEQRKSASLARNAGRICAAVFDVAPCARRLLPPELVFSGSDGPPRSTLFAVCFSLRNAHVLGIGRNSDRYGSRDRTVFCSNIQPWRMGRWASAICFCLDRTLDCEQGSFRAFVSEIRRIAAGSLERRSKGESRHVGEKLRAHAEGKRRVACRRPALYVGGHK